MKRFFMLTALLLAVMVTDTVAQTMTDVMLNLRNYSQLFLNANGSVSRQYERAVTNEDYDRIAVLGGDARVIDTPLEIALLSNAVGVIDIRPVEASRMIGNTRQADLKLGAALYQEIQVFRFLSDTNSVGRYEGMLRFITDRGNVTRADVENFYRNGIRRLISDIVDEEFNKPGQDGIVPAQVYADWERQGIVRDSNGRAVNGIELIKQVLSDFFLNPTETNYVRVRGITARILAGDIQNSFNIAFGVAWTNMLTSLSPELHSRIRDSWGGAQGIYAAARHPNDPAFRIFEIPYSVRGN